MYHIFFKIIKFWFFSHTLVSAVSRDLIITKNTHTKNFTITPKPNHQTTRLIPKLCYQTKTQPSDNKVDHYWYCLGLSRDPLHNIIINTKHYTTPYFFPCVSSFFKTIKFWFFIKPLITLSSPLSLGLSRDLIITKTHIPKTQSLNNRDNKQTLLSNQNTTIRQQA